MGKEAEVKGMNAKGQAHLPFGVIFSIILIIAFIIVAFLAIRHFLSLKDCTLVAQFYDKLQEEVESVWKSQASDQKFEAALPSGVEHVCFADMQQPEKNSMREIYAALKRNVIIKHNLFLYPGRYGCNLASQEIKHLDIQNITKNKNPLCFPNDGKVSFRLEKGFYDALVKVR